MNIEIVIVVVLPLLRVMIPFLSLILWVRLALAEALCLHLHKQVFQMGFQLNTFGMDLSEYVFSEVLFYFDIY